MSSPSVSRSGSPPPTEPSTVGEEVATQNSPETQSLIRSGALADLPLRTRTTPPPTTAPGLMQTPDEVLLLIAKHLPSEDLLELSLTARALHGKFFDEAAAGLRNYEMMDSSIDSLWRIPEEQRQAAADGLLAAIPTLRGSDRNVFLLKFSKRFKYLPDSPARVVSARRLFSDVTQAPLDEYLPIAARQLDVRWLPADERTGRFNEVLDLYERAVEQGLMPTGRVEASPLSRSAATQLLHLPLNDRAAAEERILAMREAMAARGTPIVMHEYGT
jgi:hypothetical protein